MPSANPLTLASLLRDLLRETGSTHKDFGAAIGLDGSTVSHLVSSDPHYVLGIVPCLRIARMFGESPSKLLRAAGKADIAELIESLYGRPTRRQPASLRLSPEEMRIFTQLRTLTPQTRKSWLRILDELAGRSQTPIGGSGNYREVSNSNNRKLSNF